MPGPSIRPLMGALGSAALLGGLVVGGWVLILAVVFLVYTLIGWLVDFTAEYRKVEEADHDRPPREHPGTRRCPARPLQVFAVLFVLVGLWQAGILPPASPTDAGGPGASPGASADRPPVPAARVAAALVVVAKTIAFDKQRARSARRRSPSSIDFKNEDPATITHDIDIRDGPGGAVLQDQAADRRRRSAQLQLRPAARAGHLPVLLLGPSDSPG